MAQADGPSKFALRYSDLVHPVRSNFAVVETHALESAQAIRRSETPAHDAVSHLDIALREMYRRM